jgi:hypothetical protein
MARVTAARTLSDADVAAIADESTSRPLTQNEWRWIARVAKPAATDAALYASILARIEAMDPSPPPAPLTLYIGRSVQLAMRHLTHPRRYDVLHAWSHAAYIGARLVLDVWQCRAADVEGAEAWLRDTYGMGIFNDATINEDAVAPDGTHRRWLDSNALTPRDLPLGAGVYRWSLEHDDLGPEILAHVVHRFRFAPLHDAARETPCR